MKNKAMIVLVIAVCFLGIFATLATAEITNQTESIKVLKLEQAKALNMVEKVQVRNQGEIKQLRNPEAENKARNQEQIKQLRDQEQIKKLRDQGEIKQLRNPNASAVPAKQTPIQKPKTEGQNQSSYLVYIIVLGLGIVAALLIYRAKKKR
jgi:hypothetical protein